jgi:hypothetical protein
VAAVVVIVVGFHDCLFCSRTPNLKLKAMKYNKAGNPFKEWKKQKQ